MTAGELQEALSGLADSQVMRTLITAEVEAIRNGAERETRTMRNLWYSLVKPALSRAGLLNTTTRNGGRVHNPICDNRAASWGTFSLGDLVHRKRHDLGRGGGGGFSLWRECHKRRHRDHCPPSLSHIARGSTFVGGDVATAYFIFRPVPGEIQEVLKERHCMRRCQRLR